MAALILLATLRSTPDADRPEPTPLAATHGMGAWLVPFIGVLFAVGGEFALVFWAASTTAARFDVGDSVAVTTTSAFIGGVAIGRLFGTTLIRRMTPYGAVMTAIAVALAGFAAFFFAQSYPVAVLGLFVTGLGLSIIYPVLGTRILAAFPGNAERGSQLTVLSIGTAVGLSPLILGMVAQQVELHLATLIVPIYLVLLAVLVSVTPALGRTRAPR